MTWQQLANGLIANSCGVADLYDEGTLNDVLTREFYQLMSRSLQYNWITNLKVDPIYILIQPESLMSIQKRTGQQSTATEQRTTSDKPFNKKP